MRAKPASQLKVGDRIIIESGEAEVTQVVTSVVVSLSTEDDHPSLKLDPNYPVAMAEGEDAFEYSDERGWSPQ